MAHDHGGFPAGVAAVQQRPEHQGLINANPDVQVSCLRQFGKPCLTKPFSIALISPSEHRGVEVLGPMDPRRGRWRIGLLPRLGGFQHRLRVLFPVNAVVGRGQADAFEAPPLSLRPVAGLAQVPHPVLAVLLQRSGMLAGHPRHVGHRHGPSWLNGQPSTRFSPRVLILIPTDAS